MKILIATPEAVPYVKTGGLADVTGVLLKEFRKRGVSASLILPLYKNIKKKFELYRTGKLVRIGMGSTLISAEVWTSDRSSDPEAYFIDCEELYGRKELYGTPGGDYPDNALRFAFFSRAVIEACLALEIRPDLIHCNDWQTALLPFYLRYFYKDLFRNTATLFTVHNLGYQGIFPASDIKHTGIGLDLFTPEGLEFYGKLNLMKAGLIYSDLLSTVSETYSREILEEENGFGLEGVLRKRRNDLYGIINGIDYNEWDPSTDPHLPEKYSREDMKGKAICRKMLLKEAGFHNGKLPVLGLVSRLSSQKGIDLAAASVKGLVASGLNIMIVGKGEEYYQDLLTEIAGKFAGRVNIKVGFAEYLAHLIYAGADFFLMPSRYEPCGLGQLIALRYGTIPVVRKTGGLADTIRDYDHLRSNGTGFLFADYTPPALQNAVKRALCVFTDKAKMGKMMSDAMSADFSWGKSAEKYLELYKKAIKKVRG